MAKRTDRRRRAASRAPSDGRRRTNRAPAQPARRTSRNSQQARQQRLRRRRRNRLVFRVVCGLLVCAAIVFAPTVFFRVSHVTVTGDTRYTADELIRTSGVQEGDNMFFLDSDHIAQALQAKYPYLDTVELHRRLPSTLQIEVTERTPALSVEADGAYLLLDMAGKVLEEVELPEANTAEILGAEAEELSVGDVVADEDNKLRTVLDLMNRMTQYEMNEEVDSVDIDKAYDVRMRFDGRYTILLGDLSEMEHKIQFLQAILKEPSLPETGIIDLTDDERAHYRPEDTVNAVEPEAESESQADQPADGAEPDAADSGAAADGEQTDGATGADAQPETPEADAQDDTSGELEPGETASRVVLSGKNLLSCSQKSIFHAPPL